VAGDRVRAPRAPYMNEPRPARKPARPNLAAMSKRKEPEVPTPGGAPGIAAPLGGHWAYMPDALLPLADVHLKIAGGRVLPAHASQLVLHCGTLARAPELLAAGTRARPVVLGQPFESCAEADVAAFLRILYQPAGAPVFCGDADAAGAPAVVRLANALDAAPVLAVVEPHLAAALATGSLEAAAETATLAQDCHLDALFPRAVERLVELLDGGGAASTSGAAAPLAASDVDAFRLAAKLAKLVAPDVLAAVLGGVAANARRGAVERALEREGEFFEAPARLGAAALDAARAAGAGGAAVEAGGQFVAVFDVPPFVVGAERQALASAPFRARGLDFRVEFQRHAKTGAPGAFLSLRSGAPKLVRFEVGLVNVGPEPPAGAAGSAELSKVLGAGGTWGSAELLPEAAFLDPAGGWVRGRRVAVFARVIEVAVPPAAVEPEA
jgi:hypothetical protein